MLKHLPPAVDALLGGKWPRLYACLDFETTGYSAARHRPFQLGYCVSVDGVANRRGGALANWALAGDGAFLGDLRELAKKMADKGLEHWRDIDRRVEAEGEHPQAVFGSFIRLLAAVLRNGGCLAGHNLLKFDLPFLAKSAASLGLAMPEIPAERLIDTAAIEKLVQLADVPPPGGQSSGDYWLKVLHKSAPGIKYNLDDHCFTKYGWASRVPPSSLHSADADALCVHWLMEEYGKAFAGRVAPETPPSCPASAPETPPPAVSVQHQPPARIAPKPAAPTTHRRQRKI